MTAGGTTLQPEMDSVVVVQRVPAPAPTLTRWSPPSAGTCQLWLLPVVAAETVLDLLTGSERQRLDQLPMSHARNTFATSRAAQRLIGSRYLGMVPAAVRISRDCQFCGPRKQHGRPRLPGSTVEYSVSHSGDWVLMAVTGVGVLGVDIESHASSRDTDGLLRIALTAHEQAEVAQLPPAQRSQRFFSAWTRKEAAMKLTGLGLRAAPNRLDVRATTVGVAGVAQWPDRPVYLYDLPAPAGHAAALATSVPLTVIAVCTLTGLRSALPDLSS